MECQRHKVASIPGPRSNPASVPITVVRTFTRGGSYHVEFRPDLLRFASQVPMVFKGRHSRKFLLTRGRASATTRTARPDFSLLQTHARYTRKRKARDAPKREGLEEIRSPPPSRLSVRVCRFAGPLAVSAAAPVFFLFPQSRDLLSLFFPSGRRYFSRLVTVRLHTA